MPQSSSIKTDVLILGAGPAGLICAANAGAKHKVTVLELANKLGTKLLISGGGKCNFTNRQCSAQNYICGNPHFVKSAIAQFSNIDFIELIERNHIAYEQREFGRLFCRDSARQILQMLTEMCQANNVNFILNCGVEKIDKTDSFQVTTNQGDITAKILIVATGGLTWPQVGATDLGYRIARQFGHEVTRCAPGLVPLLYNNDNLQTLGPLTGITIEAIVTFKKQTFRENILFTHTGLSGPAILQISNYIKPNDNVSINWLPDIDVYQLLTEQKQNNGSATIKATLAGLLPNRFLQQWATKHFPNKTLAECSVKHIRQAADSINNWPFTPKAAEGFNKAEVTVGGISTEQVSSKTMLSQLAEGLYFIGEVLDVTGQLGGYNLQWAWSSGTAAGRAI